MIVAMIAVRMVQPAVDKVVEVVTVGDCLVAAIRAVAMAGRMPFDGLFGGALRGIPGADLQHVFVNVIPVRRMQMSVVKIIDMTVMFDGRMAAAPAVHVGMQLMKITVIAHYGSGNK